MAGLVPYLVIGTFGVVMTVTLVLTFIGAECRAIVAASIIGWALMTAATIAAITELLTRAQ